MFTRRPDIRIGVLAIVVGLSTTPARSQVEGEANKRTLPTNPAMWLNSPPITSDMLAGKAAFLWFFEEGCPTCREKWPNLLATAKKFEGKPVVFIGVNSGNSRNEVLEYVRDVDCNWPVIVDTDRAFEKAAGVGEISLQNIHQARMIDGTGNWTPGDWSDVAGSVERVLKTAAWRVDPSVVPDVLKPAWVQVEFGNYAAAAPLISKQVNSPKPEVKAAAEKLTDAVRKELDAVATAATQARDGGDKWQAFKQYTALATKFKGFELPTDAVSTLKDLGADEGVKKELVAAKQWEAAQRVVAGGGLAGKSAASRIATQFPDTEAGRQAQAVLDRFGTGN